MISISGVFRIVLSLGVVFFLAGLSIFAIYLLSRILRVKADREHTIKLVNRGNCRCCYHLWAESPQPELTFNFLYNQIPLSQVKEISEDLGVETSMDDLSQTQNKKQGRTQPSHLQPDAALKTAQTVAAKGGAAAGLLGTLGSILPGELGDSLKAKAETARNVQTETSKAVRAPQAAQRQMDALKKSSERMGVHAEAKDHQAENAGLSEAKFSPSMRVNETKTVRVSSQTRIKTGTMAVEPGEALLLNLRIGTAFKRYPAGSFSYTIHSQQIPMDDNFGSALAVKKTGLVTFPPIGVLRYWLPALSSIVVIFLALISSLALILLIWGKI